jgi:hypothetical protein
MWRLTVTYTKIAIALVAALTLTACSKPVEPIVVDQRPIEKPVIVLPPVDEFNSRTVEWIVVTPDNIEQVFKDLEDSGQHIVLIALTSDGYERLSLNMADLLKLVQQQRAIIAAYQRYYEAQP